jgi:hypothetical protein
VLVSVSDFAVISWTSLARVNHALHVPASTEHDDESRVVDAVGEEGRVGVDPSGSRHTKPGTNHLRMPHR